MVLLGQHIHILALPTQLMMTTANAQHHDMTTAVA